MRTQRLNFAEFYRVAADECLRSVLVSVGDQDMAQDLVDEAFARAWASWRTVSKLITAVRESVSGVHTATPVEQIVSRGRTLRVRRRLPGAAGVLAAAAAAALTATALVSACQRYPAGTVLNQVFTSSGSGRATVMIIHPSALPPGAGVAISPSVQPALQVAVGLVHTSPQCTGT